MTAATLGREIRLDDELVTEVREGAARSRYTYDARGELVAIAEPDGTVKEYVYGADGRLLAVLHDGRRQAAYQYDDRGRLVAVDGRDGSRRHVYDAAGRLERTLRGDAGAYAYRYDPRGRVAAARCDHEETTFAYDDAARVMRVAQMVDGVALGAELTFDGAGRVVRTRFPSWDIALGCDWDERGRPRRLTCARGAAPAAELARFGSSEGAAGGPVAWSETADGVREELSAAAGPGMSVRAVLRRGASVVRETELAYGAGLRLERAGDRRHGYDELGRLRETLDGARRWRFRYDAAHDVLPDESTPPEAEADVDARDRVTRVRGRGAETDFRYNEAGELTDVRRDGVRIMRCRYDHKGRLLLRETPAGVERYLYGTGAAPLAVADAAGRPRAIYLRLRGRLVGLLDFTGGRDGEPVFLHADGSQNLLFAGRAGAPLEGPFSADPFGVPADAPAGLPYVHRGAEYHADVGLYRVGCRWYAPALRRFLTPDSYTAAPDDERLVNPFIAAPSQRGVRARTLGAWLGQPGLRNRHAYCLNDPVNRADPDGHWSFGGVLLSLLGAIWALPNTLIGLALEVSCLVGEVVRWLVSAISGGSVNWQPVGFDVAASPRLDAFALVFTGGWFGSVGPLGMTWGNVFFASQRWRDYGPYQALPATVFPPAYGGRVSLPKEDTFYEHELRHVNQYGWLGPFFLFVYLFDWMLGGFEYDSIWLERDAREHSGL